MKSADSYFAVCNSTASGLRLLRSAGICMGPGSIRPRAGCCQTRPAGQRVLAHRSAADAEPTARGAVLARGDRAFKRVRRISFARFTAARRSKAGCPRREAGSRQPPTISRAWPISSPGAGSWAATATRHWGWRSTAAVMRCAARCSCRHSPAGKERDRRRRPLVKRPAGRYPEGPHRAGGAANYWAQTGRRSGAWSCTGGWSRAIRPRPARYGLARMLVAAAGAAAGAGALAVLSPTPRYRRGCGTGFARTPGRGFYFSPPGLVASGRTYRQLGWPTAPASATARARPEPAIAAGPDRRSIVADPAVILRSGSPADIPGHDISYTSRRVKGVAGISYTLGALGGAILAPAAASVLERGQASDQFPRAPVTRSRGSRRTFRQTGVNAVSPLVPNL